MKHVSKNKTGKDRCVMKIWDIKLLINTFHSNVPSLHLLKVSENHWYSTVFRGYWSEMAIGII